MRQQFGGFCCQGGGTCGICPAGKVEASYQKASGLSTQVCGEAFFYPSASCPTLISSYGTQLRAACCVEEEGEEKTPSGSSLPVDNIGDDILDEDVSLSPSPSPMASLSPNVNLSPSPELEPSPSPKEMQPSPSPDPIDCYGAEVAECARRCSPCHRRISDADGAPCSTCETCAKFRVCASLFPSLSPAPPPLSPARPPLPPPPLGCTSSKALNYRASAVVDDGSCIIGGCTDQKSLGFQSFATYSDGSCPAPFEGCTDATGINFWARANVDDGSCQYRGCLDSLALNYDVRATVPARCTLPIFGCTDSRAGNYRPSAQRQRRPVSRRGVSLIGCLFIGCMDSTRRNFDELANIDSGRCAREFPGTLHVHSVSRTRACAL